MTTLTTDPEQLSENSFDGKEVDPELTEPSNTEEEEVSDEEMQERKRARRKKLLIAALLVGFIVFVVVDSTTNRYLADGITTFLEWVEDNVAAGFFAFMGVYFVATILFIPGSILTLGAGFVFANAFGLGPGVLIATLAVFIGASAGAIVSFLLGRYLLRDWVMTLTEKYPIFEALDAAFQEKGFRIMALLRLSPIIPFNAINYIAGVTALSFRSYCFALICILPGTVLYVFLGASAGSLADSENSGDNTAVTLIVVVCGIVFGVIAIGLTSYYAKKELNRVIEQRSGEQEDTAGSPEQGQAEAMDNV